MSRIFVTGLGIISAAGNTVAENRASLKDGRCGIGTLEFMESKFAATMPFGEIKIDTSVLREKLKAKEPGLTRTHLLAIHAFKECLQNSAITNEELTSYDTAIIGASTVGGMCITDTFYEDANKDLGGSQYLSSYDGASVTLFLQQHFGIKGISNTINTACSSSANAIMYGARLIKSGRAKRAIVGGADCLAKFTINGFNALRILSNQICQPFDKGRNGLNLGEGAAFLMLEGEETVENKKVYAELTGYANTTDAYHPSALSDQGDGPYSAMKGALNMAGLLSADISYINAHGTGTGNNDEVESRAMISLFGKVPPFASTKSFTGHTLGAAGAIEAVYSIFNLMNQEMYANLHFKNTIESTGLTPQLDYIQAPVQHVMSNSFGFGGNCSSLILSLPNPSKGGA